MSKDREGLSVLSDRWILRNDQHMYFPYTLYDIFKGEKLKISSLAFLILRIWEQNPLTPTDIFNYILSLHIELTQNNFSIFVKDLKIKQIIIPFDKNLHNTNIINKQVHKQSQIVPENCAVQFASVPYEVEMHLTNDCNLSCLHCAYNAGRKLNNELEFEKWKQLSDEIESLNIHRIILSGGEPLMYKKSKMVMKYLTTKRFRVDVLTNGTLIDDEFAAIFSSPNFSITVSLDGAKAKTHDQLRGVGSFRKAINGIKTLMKYNVSYNIATTVNKKKH